MPHEWTQDQIDDDMGQPRKKIKFDPETVVADFLGDLADGYSGLHPIRRGIPMSDLRNNAKALLAEFERNGITLHQEKSE